MIRFLRILQQKLQTVLCAIKLVGHKIRTASADAAIILSVDVTAATAIAYEHFIIGLGLIV